jgi:hypothetical protein
VADLIKTARVKVAIVPEKPRPRQVGLPITR